MVNDISGGGPSVEPGWLWRTWWVWTEPSRLVIRLFTESIVKRRIWLRLLVSGARLAGHLALGNPWWAAGLVLWLVYGVPLVVVAVAGLLIEAAVFAAGAVRGRPLLVAAFRLGVKVHRVWPRTYADTAAKSEQIQDREGGSGGGESRAPVVRSVVDHPRLPWRFWVRWPVITFRVGVAPGRSFAQLERVMAQMSANIPWVHAVELEYRTDRSSFGLLHVSVEDVLSRSRQPRWAQPTNTANSGPGVVDRLRNLFNKPADTPGLRLVKDDDEGQAA